MDNMNIEKMIAEFLNNPANLSDMKSFVKIPSIREKSVPKNGIWSEEKFDKWNNFTGLKIVYVYKGVKKTCSFNQNNYSRKDLDAMVDHEMMKLARKYRLEIQK